MIAEKFVDLFARNSGLRNKLVAEREVVLTYAVQALRESENSLGIGLVFM